MHLSWNEIRVRAKTFSDNWENAAYEKGETQSFYNDLFRVFGKSRRSVATYEQAVKKLDNRQGFIDLFWRGTLLIEQKSAGRDLTKARTQAFEYIDGLKDNDKPRYVLLSDFQNFDLINFSTREETSFVLKDMHKYVEKFSFIIGREQRTFKDQDPVNIKASELVGKLHDEIEASGFTGHDLEVFLVRLVFCLFADDTGVFPSKDMFLEYLEQCTAEDGSDMRGKLSGLFEIFDTPERERNKNEDEDLLAFPYINGSLFEQNTRIPPFTSAMRESLIEASRFNRSPISPAIFGSLFQSVMDAKQRRKKGAHYTTEKNIMKVIKPLFLDDLRAEFEYAKTLLRGKNNALDKLSAQLGRLTFFDPACGCGNFLIIAYREIRRLQIDVLKERLKKSQLELDAKTLSIVDVEQFYGIELEEFPARIAETALWMMDHIMNNELSLAFGQTFARIPLNKAPHIHNDDALELDWQRVLAAKQCSYILGNPPFIGQSYQSKFQRQQKGKTFPEQPFLVIPQVSSERRHYVPFGWLEPPIIPSDKLRYIQNVQHFQFAILTSAMHMGWMRTVTGRLESRYMYSVGVVYNTFPWPSLTDKARQTLTKTGQGILDARAQWPEATLADLYDPDAMPPANLRKAHMANDKAVDKLYRTKNRMKKFESERDRAEHLFALYEELTGPMLAASAAKKRRTRTRTVKL
ncbi:MAG: DNA methyltransferase [Robiginitomaculum sp.]